MTARLKIALASVSVACVVAGTSAYQPHALAEGHTSPGRMAGTATPNGLAATPPMGFNDWNAFKCNVSAALIEKTALAMHTNGMQQAGYDYVNIDDCWAAPDRTADGQLQADPTKFPDGIKAVADYVHGLGLKLGIYEDAGTATCAGYPGSLGHEAQDAKTFASWGVDYLKYDQCNIPFDNYPGMTHEQIDKRLYTTMSDALKNAGRPIVFSMCSGTDTSSYPWKWSGAIGNLWRTTPDIQDSYATMLSNVQTNSKLAQYAGPGHWNDPDMLEIGNGGMSTTEYQTEMSLWSVMAAPLISGTSVTDASPATLSILENKDVIAVDQDSLGDQGAVISSAGGRYVFGKRLANGDVAVALFNSTGNAATVTTDARAAGLPRGSGYDLKNLWSGQTTESTGRISAFVPAHGTAMFRITRHSGGGQLAPATTLSVSAEHTTIGARRSAQVTVALANDSSRAVSTTAAKLSVPAGWTVRSETSTRRRTVAQGHSLVAHYRVTAPVATAPLTPAMLRATASYAAGSSRYRADSSLNVTIANPVSAPLRTTNASPDPASFGQSGSNFAINAGGAGIVPLTTTARGTTPAADQYAAVYRMRSAGTSTTAETTVTAGDGLRNSQSGLLMRNHAGRAPAGVALYLTGANTVAMAWNSSGGRVVDTASAASAKQTLPVTLKLVWTGGKYTGFFSTDDGQSWTQVASATVARSASAGTQDVGIYHSSGTAGAPTEADFSGFTVSH